MNKIVYIGRIFDANVDANETLAAAYDTAEAAMDALVDVVNEEGPVLPLDSELLLNDAAKIHDAEGVRQYIVSHDEIALTIDRVRV